MFKKCLFSQIGKLYIFVLLSFKCQFSVSIYLTKCCFFFVCFFNYIFILVEHKTKSASSPPPPPKAQCTCFVFVFFKLGNLTKKRKKREFGHRCFPTIKLWLNGSCFQFDPLRTFFLIGPQYAVSCWLHTALQICHGAFSGFIY